METFVGLARIAGLSHGVSTRAGGVSRGPWAALNLGRSTADDPRAVEENRRRAARSLGFEAFVNARQVHGARVVEVGGEGVDPGEADALMTDRPGVLLAVLGADCPGVALVDPGRRALAVVHAGWRGTAGGIVGAAVRALAARYGCRPEALAAAVGPGIRAPRYEVGPEVVEALRDAIPGAREGLQRGARDRWHVDLAALLRLQLLAAGVRDEAIELSPHCTYDEAHHYYSHRRDGPEAGRHALLAGWTR